MNRDDTSLLSEAMAANTSSDALNFGLTPAQWTNLATYMMPLRLDQGHLLIQPGEFSRELYFLESGSLSVHAQDSKGRIRLSIVAPGSAVGEAGFFSKAERGATVQAAGACKVWVLTHARFSELANRQPAIAAAVVMELASLLARRIRSRTRRFSVT